MKTSNYLAVVVLSSLVLSGCASKAPSFGESVKAEGNAVAELGAQWDKGQSLMRKGNKLIRKGNDQIAEGKENVADGEAMVKSGRKMVEDAEKAYEQSRTVEPVE